MTKLCIIRRYFNNFFSCIIIWNVTFKPAFYSFLLCSSLGSNLGPSRLLNKNEIKTCSQCDDTSRNKVNRNWRLTKIEYKIRKKLKIKCLAWLPFESIGVIVFNIFEDWIICRSYANAMIYVLLQLFLQWLFVSIYQKIQPSKIFPASDCCLRNPRFWWGFSVYSELKHILQSQQVALFFILGSRLWKTCHEKDGNFVNEDAAFEFRLSQ